MRHVQGIGPFAALATLALALLVAAGCVYDWDLGAPVAAEVDAGGGDAGSSDAGPGCDALVQKVQAARVAAKTCTLGAAGQCGGSIVDECGCTSFVKDPESPEASAFSAAVEEIEASNCPASCPASCMLGMTGTCLLSAGMGPYCLP
ncbi:hypothetical protein [Polyangium aurulentum]|uniref:hypothetical protein n=1 Tax=Polyangium aurulentum TaxID=2567896 RepID=UPI00146D398F|nr:hypothetical protein [Polyangium aurulentum]UQA54833.1 hypothetical protein E8A73_026060 [Polyangium aurulentum]